jgi:hypothetical protein
VDLAIAIVVVVAAVVAFDVARTAATHRPRPTRGEADQPRGEREVTTTQKIIRVDLDRRS